MNRCCWCIGDTTQHHQRQNTKETKVIIFAWITNSASYFLGTGPYCIKHVKTEKLRIPDVHEQKNHQPEAASQWDAVVQEVLKKRTTRKRMTAKTDHKRRNEQRNHQRKTKIKICIRIERSGPPLLERLDRRSQERDEEGCSTLENSEASQSFPHETDQDELFHVAGEDLKKSICKEDNLWQGKETDQEIVMIAHRQNEKDWMLSKSHAHADREEEMIQ